MRLATRLAALDLADWQGERHSLAEYWRDQPIVLVFIRHFG
jgi:hypothetical protein